MITNINPTGPFIMLNKYTEQHGENVSIGLSSEGEAILRWAQSKMNEERRVAELAKANPTVADAVSAVKLAEEQLKIVVKLVE